MYLFWLFSLPCVFFPLCVFPFINSSLFFFSARCLAVSHLFIWQGRRCFPCNNSFRWKLRRGPSFSYSQLYNTICPLPPPSKEIHSFFSGQLRSSRKGATLLNMKRNRELFFWQRCVIIECLCNFKLGNDGWCSVSFLIKLTNTPSWAKVLWELHHLCISCLLSPLDLQPCCPVTFLSITVSALIQISSKF